MEQLWIFVIFSGLINSICGNYHGPFLLWGPKQLNDANLPALQSVDEKLLTLMYSEAKGIILFVRNGTSKLNKENFPSFSELISKNKWAYYPQENLPAKPVDYNSNVEVITLVGPASQQDIELGALFRDAESVYGVGKVLGILSNQAEDGHFMYKRQAVPIDDDDDDEKKDEEDKNEKEEKEIEKENEKGKQKEKEKEREREKDETKLMENENEKNINVIKFSNYSLIYKEGKAILYAKSKPELKLEILDGVEYLTNKIPQSETWDDIKGVLSVGFRTERKEKITIRFNIPINNGYWCLNSVDVEIAAKDHKVSLPIVGVPPCAPKTFSYKCAQGELMFKNANGSLNLSNFQVQAHLEDGQGKFSEAYDCVGFMSAAIWSGILVSTLLIGVVFIGILALLSIKTPNRFESSRNKQLTFTVQE